MLSMDQAEAKVCEAADLSFSATDMVTIEALPSKLTALSLTYNHSICSSMGIIQSYTALEELYVRGNSVESLSSMPALTRLRRLDVSDNCIADLSGIESLTRLTHLSIERNQVSSLELLAQLPDLMELYASENKLTDLSCLDALLQLNRLMILDLAGNSMCASPSHRSYTL
jgi:internalin A